MRIAHIGQIMRMRSPTFSTKLVRDDGIDTLTSNGPAHVLIWAMKPCKGSVPGPTATISPTQRDLHVLAVDEHGRMNWQKASGYNTRSKVEAAISRYKHVIGDTLKSCRDARRATEVAIAIKSLNRMNQLGCRLAFWRGANF